MGVLLDGLPNAIGIDENVYKIRPDYRTCIRIILAFEDSELTKTEKVAVLLQNLYCEMPSDIAAATKKGIRFLDCGSERAGNTDIEPERRYSFAQDEKYIYAGVDRVLNGRLSRGELVHWWEFCNAFMDLPENCTMSRILYYRIQHAKGALTKEERRFYNENRDMLELKQELTVAEREQKDCFMELLGK